MDYRNAPLTRHSGILHALIPHCGILLTPDGVDTVLASVEKTATEGPTSWAFRPEDAATAERARIRRELLEAIHNFSRDWEGVHARDGSTFSINVFDEDDFRAALDRILPEEAP